MSCLQAYVQILERVKKAADQAGHPVELMVVSKNASADQLKELLDFGVTSFGESRLQALESKWLEGDLWRPEISLNFIGPLQSNKLARLAKVCEGILSLAQPKHLALIPGIEKPKATRYFCQVNVGREPQKSGVLPEDLPAFIAQAQAARIPLVGLMCIPPLGQDPQPYFLQLKALAQGLPHLSMGMSQDFEQAIACGATLVRVGSGIFGG